MRIVCVGYLHGSGGAERQITNLANALSAYGHDVSLIVLAENNQRFPISPRVNIIDLTAAEKNQGPPIMNRFRELKKVLKMIKPDVSIHFWVQSVYFCYLLPKTITGNIIYSERGDPGDAEYNGLLGVVRNISFHRVAHFVFQSNAAKNYFSELIQARSSVIPNAVDVSDIDVTEIKNQQEIEKTIVNVGRLHPQKNQMLLIKSFARIAKDIPDYKLKIFGEGELRKEMEDLINSFSLCGRVIIEQPTSAIHNILLKSSLFVLSSDFEGMPNVLLESMALGKICISTDYSPGGVKDIIEDGINGFVVPANDETSLAEKMLYAINNISKLEQMSSMAKKIRLSHSFESIYREWNLLICKVNDQNNS